MLTEMFNIFIYLCITYVFAPDEEVVTEEGNLGVRARYN
jgi:hypothetical protein